VINKQSLYFSAVYFKKNTGDERPLLLVYSHTHTHTHTHTQTYTHVHTYTNIYT